MKSCVILLICLAACTARSSGEKAHRQAVMLHLSMMQKAGMIDDRLRELRRDTTIGHDSLDRLSALLDAWKADVVEVPGAEQGGHHDHAHRHEALMEVTPEQMLEIQTALDERLSHIGKRLAALKQDTTHEAHVH